MLVTWTDWHFYFICAMEFVFDDDDLIWNVNISSEKQVSRFDSLLTSQWEIASGAGVCRYRLDNLLTKILPGKFGFVAQVNYFFRCLRGGGLSDHYRASHY